MPLPYDQISPYIFVGNAEAVANYNKHFALIVNVTTQVPAPEGVNMIRIPVNDSATECKKLFDFILSTHVLEKIHQHVQKKQNVLVNCQMGMHRSCTVAACYYLKFHKMKIDETIAFMRNKRKIAFNPVYALRSTLEMFYQYLRGQKKSLPVPPIKPAMKQENQAVNKKPKSVSIIMPK